ncbi:bifunctional phosphopantothenoylcysteine decarboxylase/phosphopantothenate--cysteine ligase CoaBC [Desulfogranum mediterraneum]|uniref:bifunctional phosphopantothenoylcysteine decarboxylase/phosphopantothenate--cysteine ligase CoaBC n=1 Tax=Desulfogranum mediterraneum TaxID=160661 RepID=UPI000428336E|nr:bifunctional phosphopantothenoylcysteine decarboxylase/phosphopantothenate--cysteine ligase CoaBC [Desulfogranum mediterraneum]
MKESIVKSDKPGLQGVRVLLGVTGSIAAYKAAEWVRELVKEEALVTVMMTDSACEFVSSLTFAALSGNRVYRQMFAEDPEGVMAHINLSRDTDILLIAPATAQTLSRLSHGMGDDLISTTVLAARKPVVICPAMNTNMFLHPASQQNLERLRSYGYQLVDPDSGSLACGEEGTGRLPEWDVAREALLGALTLNDLEGRKVVVTAGPTREALDPARYLTNRSSGKMGYALARAARRRGAKVTLVSGPVDLDAPPGIELVRVQSARQMESAVLEHAQGAAVVVKAAAVADYRPATAQEHKIKKKAEPMHLDLVKNNDILATLGQNRRPGQILVGFAAESQNHRQEGFRKLTEKGADLIVVNDILGSTTGFDVDTNQVTLVEQNQVTELPLMSKEGTANQILNRVVALLEQQ